MISINCRFNVHLVKYFYQSITYIVSREKISFSWHTMAPCHACNTIFALTWKYIMFADSLSDHSLDRLLGSLVFICTAFNKGYMLWYIFINTFPRHLRTSIYSSLVKYSIVLKQQDPRYMRSLRNNLGWTTGNWNNSNFRDIGRHKM